MGNPIHTHIHVYMRVFLYVVHTNLKSPNEKVGGTHTEESYIQLHTYIHIEHTTPKRSNDFRTSQKTYKNKGQPNWLERERRGVVGKW